MKRWHILFLVLLPIAIVVLLTATYPSEQTDTEYGVTWSKPYAEELGIDSQQGLIATLDDLGVRHFRIPVYWNEAEKTRGVYDFSAAQAQLDEIAKRKGTVILAIGSRLPRWPECWEPDWTHDLSMADRAEAQLQFVRATYEQFANHPTVAAWQVENEPTIKFFSDCQNYTPDLVRAELNMVRGLELQTRPKARRPIIVTHAGEISTWLGFAGYEDEIGISVYRIVMNPVIGLISYDWIPPQYYLLHAALVRPKTGPTFVSEFQMEPWSRMPLQNTPVDEQMKTFDQNQMKKNIRFAKHLPFDSIYFWGAEWWYWMKTKQGIPEFWDLAKTINWK